MHYGSYFGGLYALEIDENTGFALHPAIRASVATREIEAFVLLYS